jgi:hypothetical protein
MNDQEQNTTASDTLLTTKLGDGTVVLAKRYKGDVSPKTYANRSQAQRSAGKVNGEVIGKRPFYVRVPA